MSEVELFFLYDCGVVAEAVRNLRRDFPNIRVVFVTKGKDGSECFFGKSHVAAETLPNVKSVDATGAGDTFFGCCLARLSETGIDVLDERRICEILRFANAAAALITTRKGALGAMPSTEDVLSLINL
jgi:fructokinase